MTTTPATDRMPIQPADARDLQTRLYRDIGISAVTAALRFTKQPEPGRAERVKYPLPPLLRDDYAA